MKKITFVLFFIVLVWFLNSGNTNRPDERVETVPPTVAEKFTEEQRSLLESHNSVRKSKGLGPLEMDESLCGYAQNHAQYMATKGRLFHSSMSSLRESGGSGTVGENIAWGQDTVDEVVSTWMGSPMHRWNMLGSSYKRVGFGIKEDERGRKYWCVVFSS